MAQVFIVDEKTFKVHLEYKFAGTGAKDNNLNFINDNSEKIQWTTEKMLVGMLADISRIRKNDKVIFYLQQSKNREGMFFGSFKTIERAFLCNDEYPKKELEKKLIFRVLIEPDEVYPIGISERECLDSLDGIKKPYELCWSLIYRKLKGNRGCTMITDAEYNFIMNKIRNKNRCRIQNSNNLTFNSNTSKIEVYDTKYNYTGRKESIDIYNRMKFKYLNNNAFETHLQAYILQQLENIKSLVKPNVPVTWIGNEMACGVGMQSIDVIFFQETKEQVDIVVCELKDEQPQQYIEKQIEKYVNWLEQYIVPTFKNKKVIIKPVIIAPVPKEKTINIIKKINLIQHKNKQCYVDKIHYVSFEIINDKVSFSEVNYEEYKI